MVCGCSRYRAKLDNTILSRSALVGERAQLKDCELAPGVTVQNDGNAFMFLLGDPFNAWPIA